MLPVWSSAFRRLFIQGLTIRKKVRVSGGLRTARSEFGWSSLFILLSSGQESSTASSSRCGDHANVVPRPLAHRVAQGRTGSHRIAQSCTANLFDRDLQIDYWRN